MKRLLLIVDMEGAAGIDHVSQIIAGTPEYDAACRLLTEQVNAAVDGFRNAGCEQVIVSDSHRGGAAANVAAADLHPIARLVLEEDAYHADLFAHADAVACLGMHAPAGTAGFVAHTVSINCDWSLAGRRLSETDIVAALAAEAGVPLALVAGDNVLCDGLAGRVDTVICKHSLSMTACHSHPRERVLYTLRETAAHCMPRYFPLPEAQPITIRFKSAWQAQWAARSGHRRLSHYSVAVDGGTFRERYEKTHRLVNATTAPLIGALRGSPGSPELIEDVSEIVTRPFVSAGEENASLPNGDVGSTLRAFLRWTDADAEFSRALRALVLHIAQSWAPASFARFDLGPVLDRALEALAQVPLRFDAHTTPHDAMSRIDAWYIRTQRGLPCAQPDRGELARYLTYLPATGHHTHAWLLREMVASLDHDGRIDAAGRPYRGHSRRRDLYWLTHLFFLETRYLRRPLDTAGWEARIEELHIAAPWLVEQGHTDLAAEVALCLQTAGEHASWRHRQIIDLLIRSQEADGTLLDGSMGDPPALLADHATGLAFLVYAGVEEWNRQRGAGATAAE